MNNKRRRINVLQAVVLYVEEEPKVKYLRIVLFKDSHGCSLNLIVKFVASSIVMSFLMETHTGAEQ